MCIFDVWPNVNNKNGLLILLLMDNDLCELKCLDMNFISCFRRKGECIYVYVSVWPNLESNVK